jgi:hypothetical protein
MGKKVVGQWEAEERIGGACHQRTEALTTTRRFRCVLILAPYCWLFSCAAEFACCMLLCKFVQGFFVGLVWWAKIWRWRRRECEDTSSSGNDLPPFLASLRWTLSGFATVRRPPLSFCLLLTSREVPRPFRPHLCATEGTWQSGRFLLLFPITWL